MVPTIIEGGYFRGTELFCDNGYIKDLNILKCTKDTSVAICSETRDQNGIIAMTCRCSLGYKWLGGTKCQKYNIQTGELIEEKPVIAQSMLMATSVTNNINQNIAKSPSASIKVFTRTLKRGMSGNDVKQLQIFLQKLNYLPSTQVPSTYFGTITSNALIRFQKDNKIQPAAGLFGPATQAKLLSLVNGI